VYNNYVYNNTIGLSVACEGSNNLLYDNYVVNNRFGAEVRFYSPVGENNTLYHNNFVNNTVQVNTDPIIILPGTGNYSAYHSGFFDNGKEGNYWSDYEGTDNDGDGIGDTPYIIDENRTDHFPLMEPVDIEVISEFPSWIIIPLFIIATVVVIIYRNSLRRQVC
jgi:nitrous oxidase accessory protein NosD